MVQVAGALIETELGSMEVLLYPAHAPITVENFQTLAGAGFYDGLLWHRVIDDFVIQGGDPSGTGSLGSERNIPLERNVSLFFSAGALGMARDVQEDSANSQYFITETPQPHLHAPRGTTGQIFGAYAVFGQVRRAEYAPMGGLDGMAAVRALASVPTIPGADRPVEDVHMTKVTLVTLNLTAREFAQYPLRVLGPEAAGDATVVLETPGTLFADGVPVSFQWWLEPTGDVAPSVSAPRMRVTGPSGESVVPLAAHPEHALLLTGKGLFTAPGTHTLTLEREGAEAVGFDVEVGAPTAVS